MCCGNLSRRSEQLPVRANTNGCQSFTKSPSFLGATNNFELSLLVDISTHSVTSDRQESWRLPKPARGDVCDEQDHQN